MSEIMSAKRDRVVIATGAYNYVWRAQDVRRTFERRLRQFRTDYIDIFPFLGSFNPGVISYTATRWSYLLRRPRTLPKNTRVPTAGDCYRFVLSDPHVHAVLTAPRNERQLRENIEAVKKGPLGEDDMKFMREFGDVVHNQNKWFM